MASPSAACDQRRDCIEPQRHTRKSRQGKQAGRAKQDVVDSDSSSHSATFQYDFPCLALKSITDNLKAQHPLIMPNCDFSSSLVRHIKSLASTLKQSLLNQEPWSTTIEHHRKCLRQQYLALIFYLNSENPGSSQPSVPVKSYALEAINLLWLDTSYGLINIYRNKLGTIDREIERTAPTNHKKLGPKNQRVHSDRIHASSPSVGPVARRKLLQQFRSFLRAEDTFWKSLIHRLINHYHVDTAKGCLKILKIYNDPAGLEEFRVPAHEQVDGQNLASSTTEGILLVHKALICFGDLIRYGELYARTGRQSSPFSGSKSQPRQKLDKNSVVERDWSRSQDCYAQARLLIPTNGNPSNQLAILSSYIPDVVSSVYYYYRALCVKNPFPTARQNLGGCFARALAKMKETDSSKAVSGPQELPLASSDSRANPDKTVSELKSCFIALHGSLYTRASDPFADGHTKLCCQFTNHLKDRLLPPELILRMVATCMGAVWYARVCVGTTATRPRNSDHSDSRAHPTAHLCTTEVNATVLFLLFSAALLSVAKDELASIDGLSSQGDLSQNMPAVLRRILPAMRIISKWVLSGHFDHINRVKLRLVRLKKHKLSSQLVSAEAEFWAQYHQAIQLAKQHFPIDKLPLLDNSVKLEEDLELAGFLPTERARKLEQSESSKPSDQFGLPPPCEAHHPNEEHLMRLGDLQRDADRIEAKLSATQPNLAESHKSAQAIEVDQNESKNHQMPPFVKPPTPPKPAAEDPVHTTHALSDEYDNETDEEDPVELAMRAVVAQQMDNEQATRSHDTLMLQSLNNSRDVTTDEDEDDDDEVILYLTNPPTGTADRPGNSTSSMGPSATAQFTSGISDTVQLSSILDPTPVKPAGSNVSTAADLLASIMSAPMASPNHSHGPPNPTMPPSVPAAARWNPLPPDEQISPGLPLRTPVARRAPRHGGRIPSVSLPKPAEASAKTNIWSTLPPSSSFSSMEPNVIMASDWPASAAFLGHVE
ncbi:hypothetical protein PCANC_02196 [Puccinia coronata f. sp. avenae]|uniref:DNA/RNA-binding domain-containing protein n=1 Tax=Puccinia coronata f. sp. avenae TaxID=200324 RepID=A0A2N5W0R9_9BASI|nr:hypothetical protein PCANC_02196 [Puccinia coronata f. sp. avenae]